MKVSIKGAAEDINLGDIGEMTFEIERILVPTDGSAPSVAATEYAVMMAKTFGATIKAVFVDTGEAALSLPEEVIAEDVFEGDLHPMRGIAVAQAMCQSNGVTCETEVAKGGVAKRIVHVAEDWDADLIVIGDTGRTGLKRIALGSVAETVVKGSPIPVLVVKAD
ncbi:MAG: universal stress protein [Coriobacteriia bacterium]|nr:universal stress protein [Coriobacteriia bacterium]